MGTFLKSVDRHQQRPAWRLPAAALARPNAHGNSRAALLTPSRDRAQLGDSTDVYVRIIFVYNCAMLTRLMPASRVRVLETLLLHPGSHPLYLRELARASGAALHAVQREVATLTELGVVRRVPRGREVYFHVAEEHPLVEPFRALLRAGGATGPPPPWRRPPTEPPAAPPRDHESWRVW